MGAMNFIQVIGTAKGYASGYIGTCDSLPAYNPVTI